MYDLIIKSSAEKEMDRLSARVRGRIVAALEKLRSNPRPRGCLKLKGDDELWRIRVGDYRVIYTIQDDVLIVMVVRVALRRDVYS
ncbi:MAG: type II toxin-antitoxin system RelE/ParE family toxin [Planctomycetaceae bacterium]